MPHKNNVSVGDQLAQLDSRSPAILARFLRPQLRELHDMVQAVFVELYKENRDSDSAKELAIVLREINIIEYDCAGLLGEEWYAEGRRLSQGSVLSKSKN